MNAPLSLITRNYNIMLLLPLYKDTHSIMFEYLYAHYTYKLLPTYIVYYVIFRLNILHLPLHLLLLFFKFHSF